MKHVFVLLILSAALLYASVVVIVEVPDDDARLVYVANVVDGDTVELADGRRVRLVGYDAYELSEPLGARARQELRSLCLGEAYLDVDDLEPQDRYGRVLGYLWCRRGAGDVTWHVNIQKYFIIGEGRKYTKRLIYIPPDEHPYTLWVVRHVVKLDRAVKIYVYNDTKSPYVLHGDAVVLTSGVYEVYYNRRLVAKLKLMNPNATVVYLSIEDAAGAAPAPTATVTTTVTRTVTTTTTITSTTTLIRTLRETATVTKTATTTVTSVAVVEKPYVHPLAYVITAAAVAAAVLAAYVARRSRTTARR